MAYYPSSYTNNIHLLSCPSYLHSEISQSYFHLSSSPSTTSIYQPSTTSIYQPEPPPQTPFPSYPPPKPPYYPAIHHSFSPSNLKRSSPPVSTLSQPHSPWQELPFADGRTVYFNRITKEYTCIPPPANEPLQHRDELFRTPSRASSPPLAPPRAPSWKAPLSPSQALPSLLVSSAADPAITMTHQPPSPASQQTQQPSPDLYNTAPTSSQPPQGFTSDEKSENKFPLLNRAPPERPPPPPLQHAPPLTSLTLPQREPSSQSSQTAPSVLVASVICGSQEGDHEEEKKAKEVSNGVQLCFNFCSINGKDDAIAAPKIFSKKGVKLMSWPTPLYSPDPESIKYSVLLGPTTRTTRHSLKMVEGLPSCLYFIWDPLPSSKGQDSPTFCAFPATLLHHTDFLPNTMDKIIWTLSPTDWKLIGSAPKKDFISPYSNIEVDPVFVWPDIILKLIQDFNLEDKVDFEGVGNDRGLGQRNIKGIGGLIWRKGIG